MAVKSAFILIETLVAIAFFSFSFLSIFYLTFVILQTKTIAVKRMQALNVAINTIEKLRDNIKISQNKVKFDLKVSKISINYKKNIIPINFAKIDVNGQILPQKKFKLTIISGV